MGCHNTPLGYHSRTFFLLWSAEFLTRKNCFGKLWWRGRKSSALYRNTASVEREYIVCCSKGTYSCSSCWWQASYLLLWLSSLPTSSERRINEEESNKEFCGLWNQEREKACILHLLLLCFLYMILSCACVHVLCNHRWGSTTGWVWLAWKWGQTVLFFGPVTIV